MTTTTDLRAALRDKLIAAYDAAWDTTGEGKNAEYTGPSYTQEVYERERAEAIDKILADAPPTVAELLPMVDARHEAWWQSASAPDVTLRARLDTVRGIVFEARLDDRSAWVAICALPSDITQPARLVEVSP